MKTIEEKHIFLKIKKANFPKAQIMQCINIATVNN